MAGSQSLRPNRYGSHRRAPGRLRQSHLTYYFPTRQDLLEAVIARVVDGIATTARGAVKAAEAPGHGALVKRLATAVADVEHMRM